MDIKLSKCIGVSQSTNSISMSPLSYSPKGYFDRHKWIDQCFRICRFFQLKWKII